MNKFATLSIVIILLLSSCSIVFTSSLQGTIMDYDEWLDGNNKAIEDATVFLYDDEGAWNADYNAYHDWDASTLPDTAGKSAYRYFQTSSTDSNGRYRFSGFIWKTNNSQFGKTGDRRQVYILVYHRDYGLWKNPTPIFIVSDTTMQVDPIRISELWNTGRLAGRALDWANGKGLSGVSVAFYLPKSWAYADDDSFTDIVWDTSPSSSTLSGDDGQWLSDIRFPKMPNRAEDMGKAPIRIVYSRSDWRANDPADGPGLSNPGLVTDLDIDQNGRSPESATPDYDDAFISFEIEEGNIAQDTGSITMQRWRFSTTVSGRIHDGGTPKTYLNGYEVLLTLPDGSEYKGESGSRTIGETQTDGHFDLGTISWELKDITDQNSNISVLDEQQSGQVEITLTVRGPDGTDRPISSGDRTWLKPDTAVTLNLAVTP